MKNFIISFFSLASMLLIYNIFYGASNSTLYILILLVYSITFSTLIFLLNKIKNKSKELNVNQDGILHNFLVSLMSISLTLTITPAETFYVESLMFLCLVFFLMPAILIAFVDCIVFYYTSIFFNKISSQYKGNIKYVIIISYIIIINFINIIKSIIINM